MLKRTPLLWALGGVVALVVLAGVAMRVAVNPEMFKPQIEAFASRATGLTLRIEGPIRLSYFPWLGIEMGRASLGGLKGFENDPFVSVDGADIKVRLSALWRGDLEAGALRLKNPSLTLIKAADGRANWQALPVREVTLENDRVVVRSDTGQTAFHYLLEGFAVTGGAVTFEDRAAGRTIRLTDLAAKADRVASGESSDIAVAFKLALDKPQVSVATSLAGKLTVDPANLVFGFDKADLDIKAEAQGLPFSGFKGTGRANVTVRGNDGRVQIRDMALTAMAAGGVFPAKGETAKLSGSLDYDAQAGRLAFSDMDLEALGLKLTGRIDGSMGAAGAEPRFVWQYATNSFNPKTLLAALGITLPGLSDTALQSVETRGEVTFTPSSLGLKVAPLRLDGQNIAFSAEVTDFKQPAMHFELTADSLDLDRYLPAASKGAKPAETPAAKEEPGKPDPMLQTARINGQISIGTLKIKGLDLSKVRVTVAGADGTIAVKPFSFGVSDGTVVGALTMGVAKPVPPMTFAATVSGVQVGPVLKAVTGKVPLTGILTAKADLRSAGRTPQALLGSLSGPASFRLDNGRLEGFSVSPQLLASFKAIGGLTDLNAQSVLDGVAAFGQGLASSHQGSTVINDASASFQCDKGVAATRDILVRSPVGQINGGGRIDLGHSRLDVALRAKLTGVATVPVLVKGSFDAPSVSVDSEALTSEALRAVPSAVGKSLKEGGQKVLDAVKGIFGN